MFGGSNVGARESSGVKRYHFLYQKIEFQRGLMIVDFFIGEPSITYYTMFPPFAQQKKHSIQHVVY